MAETKIHLKSDSHRDFIKVFDEFGYKYDRWKVWQDFLDVSAAALQLPFYGKEAADRIQAVHDRYGDDYKKMDELFTIMVNALDFEYQDFLGSVFMGLGLNNKWTGQFFTPYNLCLLMAESTMGNKESLEAECREKHYLWGNDPCVGGGAMLIAACDVMRRKDFNFQQNVLFVAQDIDLKCVNMAYIQLSLIGAAAQVIWGNSLAVECRKAWYTPVFFLNDWPEEMRENPQIFEQIDRLEVESGYTMSMDGKKMRDRIRHNENKK